MGDPKLLILVCCRNALMAPKKLLIVSTNKKLGNLNPVNISYPDHLKFRLIIFNFIFIKYKISFVFLIGAGQTLQFRCYFEILLRKTRNKQPLTFWVALWSINCNITRKLCWNVFAHLFLLRFQPLAIASGFLKGVWRNIHKNTSFIAQRIF